MMDKRIVSIQLKHNNAKVATAEVGNGVDLFEGAWYFAPEHVDMSQLKISSREYHCPYKGTCNWVDTSDMDESQVGWRYFDTLDGYEWINGRVAFYAGERKHTRQS